ncbi:hypothetical protein J5N97_029271 [Dioscorea zingiberensis]|uniref:Uncharacterized protein n=1 Tax=Dioscorea zingiberensis TaxID=325984 RepID=A0A9D5C128_9LILI|nr:hypothetical protein J5N97_029271 [Dioscorea zingiberensis]
MDVLLIMSSISASPSWRRRSTVSSPESFKDSPAAEEKRSGYKKEKETPLEGKQVKKRASFAPEFDGPLFTHTHSTPEKIMVK